MLETFRINADDRKDISQKMSQFIDTKKYFVCVSTAENHVQVLWKKVEQEKNKNKYDDAVRELSRIPRAREFTSSRTCRINRDGIKSCLDKIKVRANWHSGVYCTSE